jgi:sulfoxide reductase catalytic subunit YedY
MGISSAALLLAACDPGETGMPTLFGQDALTAKEDALDYVNFYEFSLSKRNVDERAENFTIEPWEIQIDGLVANPQTIAFEDLLSRYKIDEYVYRMRCVEGWSMVLPWQGFKLNQLLKDIEPLPEARFIQFQSVYRPDEMPGQVSLDYYPWPYSEGLRLDEAMHPLTILATGMYEEPLTKQNGAPIRLVVPWKYGFKSIKSIARISLVAEQPPTLWQSLAANEYGFYANVNPAVDHPRWSQATEIRIGESERRSTLLFNGYDEVADLYEGMDLKKDF